MKWLSLLFLLFLSSCSPKIIEKIKTEIVEREILRDTTIYKTIEREVQVNKVLDTLSHLENKFAVTDARISNGYLVHSLEQKAQEIPFKIIYKDKELIIRDTTQIIKEVEKKVPTTPKLAWYSYILNAIFITGLVFIIKSKL